MDRVLGSSYGLQEVRRLERRRSVCGPKRRLWEAQFDALGPGEGVAYSQPMMGWWIGTTNRLQVGASLSWSVKSCSVSAKSAAESGRTVGRLRF
jgi:hypothetical protein